MAYLVNVNHAVHPIKDVITPIKILKINTIILLIFLKISVHPGQ